MGCISNLLPITLSFGEGRVRQKKYVNLKCARLMTDVFFNPFEIEVNGCTNNKKL
jgi:hypothetical protein